MARKQLKNKLNKKTPLLMSPFGFALAACGGGAGETPIGSGETETPIGSGLEKQSINVSDIAASFSLLMIDTADYDFDGDQDFIVSHGSYPPLERQSFQSFSLINDHGVLIRKEILGEPPLMTHGREGTFADFNNDGFLDYIFVGHGWDTSPYSGEKNALFFGTSDGFEDKSSLLPDYLDFTHSVAAGDLNGDGYNDIYVGNIYGEEMVNPYLLINTGEESFTEIELSDVNFNISSRQYLAAEIVDIDGDGTEELILGAYGAPDGSRIYSFDATHQNMVLEQILPDNLFETSLVMDVKVADLNTDGLLDIVILSTPDYNGTGLQVLFQEEDGSFWDATSSVLPVFDQTQNWVEFLELGDADGDGDLDIILSQTSDRGANAYLNENGVFVPHNAEFRLDGNREWYEVALNPVTGEQYAAHVSDGILTIEQIII